MKQFHHRCPTSSAAPPFFLPAWPPAGHAAAAAALRKSAGVIMRARSLLIVALLLSFPAVIWLFANAFLFEYFSLKASITQLSSFQFSTRIPQHQFLRRYLSLSLYGDDEFFTLGTIRNVDLAKLIYPGLCTSLLVHQCPQAF